MFRRLKVSALAVAAVVALASAAVAMGRLAGSVPGNLCTLNVKQQLKALPAGTGCKQSKTAHVGPLTIEGANWGSTDHAIALQVYVNIPKSRFMQQVDKSGTKVSLGSGNLGWENTGPSGVSVDAWVDGVGTITLLHTPLGTSSSNKKYAAPVLAFVKAVAKQI
jgi:hypothetical protein